MPTKAPIPDHVPAPLPATARAIPTEPCKVCGHAQLAEAKHIDATGYGDAVPWCLQCRECELRG